MSQTMQCDFATVSCLPSKLWWVVAVEWWCQYSYETMIVIG